MKQNGFGAWNQAQDGDGDGGCIVGGGSSGAERNGE